MPSKNAKVIQQSPLEEVSTLGEAPVNSERGDVMPQFSAGGFRGLSAASRKYESQRPADVPPGGFDEAKAAYIADDLQKLIGQIRRLGEYGPAYEIMSIDDKNIVTIEVIESDERVVFPLAEILEDPMAETIP